MRAPKSIALLALSVALTLGLGLAAVPALAETTGEASPASEVADGTTTAATGDGSAQSVDTPQPEIGEAQAAILTDGQGNVLFEKNADASFEPASITKVMTAMVALDSGIPLDRTITCQGTTLPEAAQSAGLKAGDTITFHDLLAVMLVYSANDAAWEVAQVVSGSQEAFAAAMNAKAAELGMVNSHFENPHGLSGPTHRSCARDLAVMGRYALTHYGFITNMVHTPQVTITVSGVPETFSTTDELMGVYAPLRGIKTGKEASGTTFLGAASEDGAMVYSCVLGCATDWGRFQDTLNLYKWAYGTYYKKVALATPDNIVMMQPYAFRFGYSVPVVADSALEAMVVPQGDPCSYVSMRARQGQLTIPGTSAGATLWHQGDRVLGAVAYGAQPQLRRSDSWGPFLGPLFWDQEEVFAL